jgi:ABC-type proline/glycine betaine transport system permease subunit
MQQVLEMSASPVYTGRAQRRLRLLKLLHLALIASLILSWTYGIAVTVAFLQEYDGRATQWLLFFVMFTIPATALLIMVHLALRRLNRAYDYCLDSDTLEVYTYCGGAKRKLVTMVNCHSIVAFAPVSQADPHSGRTIRTVAGSNEVWALDVRHEGQIVRLLLQPNEAFQKQLKTYVK